MASYKDIPVRETPKGIFIDIKGIYVYPGDRGRGFIRLPSSVGDNELVPFEDTIELVEVIVRTLRRAQRLDAKR